MRAIIGRVAAVLAGGILTALAGWLGVEVTDDARVALTEAITGVGMVVWLLGYAVVHRLINRRLNPTDAAKPAETLRVRGGMIDA